MIKIYSRKIAEAFCSLSLLSCVSAQSFAQEYPMRPIRIVVPYGAGGIGDFTARALAKELTISLKTSIVVENKPGASGLIAMNGVKTAAPDGYTLVMTSNTTLSAAKYLFKALAYDPAQDFAHVGLIGTFGSVALVPKNSPYKSIQEFVAYVKNNPDKAFYAYTNASSQVPAELLNAYTGIRLMGIGYKEAGQAATDLMSEQVPFMFLDTVAASSLLRGGRVMPLAITQNQPLPIFPEVIPMNKIYSGFEFSGFISVSVPKKTPAPIIEKLNSAIRLAADSKDFRNAIESNGMTIRALTVSALNDYIKAEDEKWKNYAKTANLIPQ